MEITRHIHAIRVPFWIPLGTGRRLERFTWIYLVCGERICLIDAGVAGSWAAIGECLDGIGRRPDEIALCVLTHAHPDHIGAARTIRAETGCRFAAHAADRPWIEDVEAQARGRPVPGFAELVEGPIVLDDVLADGARIELGRGQTLRVLDTPGHSPGHIALLHENDRVLIAGDALVVPASMPTYTRADDVFRSIRRLRAIEGVEVVLSSLDEAPVPREQIAERISQGIAYVRSVHRAVRASARERPDLDLPQRTGDVTRRLGLAPFAANPVSALSVASHLAANDALFDEP